MCIFCGTEPCACSKEDKQRRRSIRERALEIHGHSSVDDNNASPMKLTVQPLVRCNKLTIWPQSVKQRPLELINIGEGFGSIDPSRGISSPLPSSSSSSQTIIESGRGSETIAPESQGKLKLASVFRTRHGGIHKECYSLKNLAPPSFGGKWDGRLLDMCVPGESGVICVLDAPMGDCTSGACLPKIVKWDNDEGFTLLLDVAHFTGEEGRRGDALWNPGETFHLNCDIGGKALEIVGVTNDRGTGIELQTQNGRAQIAVRFQKDEIQHRFRGVTNNHCISIKPYFHKPREKNKHFTEPHMIHLPPIFDEGYKDEELERMRWEEVPVNCKAPLQTQSDLMPEGAMITTAMETEAEYVLGMCIGPDKSMEQHICQMIGMIDLLAVDEGKDNHPDEEQQQKIREFLGDDLCGNGTWKIERVQKYDVTDKNGEPTDESKKNAILYPDLKDTPTASILKDLPKSLGCPGMLIDTYLHIGDDGIIRDRKNFRGPLVAVKGANKSQGDCMVRYNRQVPLKKPILGKSEEDSIDLNQLEQLIYGEEINFQDALDGPPNLAPCLTVESERYRYKFVYQEEGSRPVMIELSFDVSVGNKMGKSGSSEDAIHSYGFEFGLDHLGASGGPPSGEGASSSNQVGSSSDSNSNTPQEKQGVSEPSSSGGLGKAVKKRDLHDRQDLDEPSLTDRPAFHIFDKLKDQVCSKISPEKPGVGGHKAKSMINMLNK